MSCSLICRREPATVPLTVYQSRRGRDHRGLHSPVPGADGGGKSQKNGGYAVHPGPRDGGKHELCRLPGRGRRIELFGTPEGLEQAAAEMGVPLLTRLPMTPDVARLCDEGEIERVVCEEMEPAADAVERLLKE